jgi:hypothetical protein
MSLNPSFYQRPSDVVAERPLGFWGELSGHVREKTGLNFVPQAKEVQTIAVPATVENSAAYFVSEGGETATFTTTTTVQDDLGAGLVAAINDNGVLRSRWVPTYTGGVLTMTAVWPGTVTGTVTVSTGFTDDLGTPSVVTSAATAAPVYFGRALAALASAEDTPANRSVFQPIQTDFTAQVMTITITSVAGATFTPQITFAGVPLTGDAVVHDTSDTVTALAILTEFNAILDAAFPAGASVVATQSAGAVILTAEVPGATFEADIIAAGAAGTATKVRTTGPSLATSFEKAFVGLSRRATDVQNLTIDGDDPAYGPNESVRYATRGTMIVERATAETWALGDEVWVSVPASDRAAAGKLHNAAAANRIWIPPHLLVVDQGGGTNDTTSGVVRLDMGA